MKNILLLAGSHSPKTEILDFASYVARLGKSKLVGLFVENITLDAVPSLKSLGGQMYVEEVTLTRDEYIRQEEKMRDAMRLFSEGCTYREVSAATHKIIGSSLKNIIRETRYADMIILDPAISFDGDKSAPSKLAVEILGNAECPVLIAPEYFETIDEIVFAYNGSKSSVYAIKQFYYQLPELANKKVIILHINEHNNGKDHSQEQARFNEWLTMHFSNVAFIELNGNAREELLKFFMEQPERYNKMLVSGAFGRNILSSMFKPSTADLVLKAIDIPIFITHH